MTKNILYVGAGLDTSILTTFPLANMYVFVDSQPRCEPRMQFNKTFIKQLKRNMKAQNFKKVNHRKLNGTSGSLLAVLSTRYHNFGVLIFKRRITYAEQYAYYFYSTPLQSADAFSVDFLKTLVGMCNTLYVSAQPVIFSDVIDHMHKPITFIKHAHACVCTPLKEPSASGRFARGGAVPLSPQVTGRFAIFTTIRNAIDRRSLISDYFLVEDGIVLPSSFEEIFG